MVRTGGYPMILAIILLILIVLLITLVILFSLYILLPSIPTDKEVAKDPIIAKSERKFIIPDEMILDNNENKAIVMCSCNKEFKNHPSVINIEYTCIMAKSVYGSGFDCKYACIGLGDCVKVCSQDAISIVNNTAVISNNCCGCGKCLEVCPQQIIKLIPKNTKSYVLCNNTNNSMTTCSCNQKEEKVEWNDKKDFKIWKICYKLYKRFK